MNIIETDINGAVLVESPVFKDHRGEFSRLYCSRELYFVTGGKPIVQINHSKTHSVGAIRGLHYQNPPYSEIKIVRCLKGRVMDVAVDLRADSSTFMKWSAVELTPENHRAFIIPEGCAHGFQVLKEDSELLYLHTAFYTPESEGGVRYDDPAIGVDWPITPCDLSEKDLKREYLGKDFKGIII